MSSADRRSPLDHVMRFCLENKIVVALAVVMLIGWGLLSAPFDWSLGGLPRDPVPVDAIPDIGENQQIVFTDSGARGPPGRLRRQSRNGDLVPASGERDSGFAADYRLPPGSLEAC